MLSNGVILKRFLDANFYVTRERCEERPSRGLRCSMMLLSSSLCLGELAPVAEKPSWTMAGASRHLYAAMEHRRGTAAPSMPQEFASNFKAAREFYCKKLEHGVKTLCAAPVTATSPKPTTAELKEAVRFY